MSNHGLPPDKHSTDLPHHRNTLTVLYSQPFRPFDQRLPDHTCKGHQKGRDRCTILVDPLKITNKQIKSLSQNDTTGAPSRYRVSVE